MRRALLVIVALVLLAVAPGLTAGPAVAKTKRVYPTLTGSWKVPAGAVEHLAGRIPGPPRPITLQIRDTAWHDVVSTTSGKGGYFSFDVTAPPAGAYFYQVVAPRTRVRHHVLKATTTPFLSVYVTAPPAPPKDPLDDPPVFPDIVTVIVIGQQTHLQLHTDDWRPGTWRVDPRLLPRGLTATETGVVEGRATWPQANYPVPFVFTDTHGHTVTYTWQASVQPAVPGGDCSSRTGALTRLTQGNRASASPALSADGQVVAFSSNATDLGFFSTSGVFVCDRSELYLRQLTSDPAAGAVDVSATGRFVAWATNADPGLSSEATAHQRIAVWDLQTQGPVYVTGPDTDAADPQVSADGRYVTFTSMADDLGPSVSAGDPHAYRWDRDTGDYEVLGDPAAATFAPSISDDGQSVAYDQLPLAAASPDTPTPDPQAPVKPAVQVDDFDAWTTTILTNDTFSGWDPAISADGSTVVYSSDDALDDSGISQLIGWDRDTNELTALTTGNDSSYAPRVSGDGRYVAFASYADDLAPPRTADPFPDRADVLVLDRSTDDVSRVAAEVLDDEVPQQSDDGRYVGFASGRADLVPGDDDGQADVFVWDRNATSP